MTKVLVSYQIDANMELHEDLWVMRKFGTNDGTAKQSVIGL